MDFMTFDLLGQGGQIEIKNTKFGLQLLTLEVIGDQKWRSTPPLLTLVLFELQKIQRQFWKALKKWAWVF